MTNLIAVVSVCIVTNVTQGNNERGCATCDMLERAALTGGAIPAIYHPVHAAPPYQPTTEKTETTEVVEVKTLRFTWEGEECTAKRERILSIKVKRWTRKDTWVEE